jgi:transposase
MNRSREVVQHENTRPHTACATVDSLANHNVTVLPWPSMSPNLNTIEHLWDDLDRRVYSSQPAPQSARTAVGSWQKWGRIQQDGIRQLIESMPRLVRTVLQANRGHNRY